MEMIRGAALNPPTTRASSADLGSNRMEGLDLPNPTRLHRRGMVFAHRDLEGVLDAQRKGEPFGVLTGLMPSGKMHLGIRWSSTKCAGSRKAVAT
ncbi:MAG: hypothetical protein CM15mP128_4110 [Methanobacteriota archaeon]|nr:MAG: hypothetical protein CM15mP128_4110 [Euryarchaeota archaeon]